MIPAETPVAPVFTPWPFYSGLGLVMSDIDRDPCPCTDDQTVSEDHRCGAVLRGQGLILTGIWGFEAKSTQNIWKQCILWDHTLRSVSKATACCI